MMSYWLILYPGPTKLNVKRGDYEVAAQDANPTITLKNGLKYKMRNRKIFTIEQQEVACVIADLIQEKENE